MYLQKPCTETLFPLTPRSVTEGECGGLEQVYADFSGACVRFAPQWEATANELEGIAKLGRVDLSSDPSFGWDLYGVGGSLLPGARQWPPELPFVIGLAPTCESLSCAVRFRSELKAEALQLFVADVLLHLPQVPAFLSAHSGSLWYLPWLYLWTGRYLAPNKQNNQVCSHKE